MDSRLENLIYDYLDSVKSIVVLMSRSGITAPYSRASWMLASFPRIGELDGGFPYRKHGAGCEVNFKGRVVDFDFGEEGEIDEVECFRLQRYAKESLEGFGFESLDEIKESFRLAVASGSLVRAEYSAYFIAGQPRLRAGDVDCRLPGDLLPPFSQDVVLTIYSHNFLPADLMRRNYEKLYAQWRKQKKLSTSRFCTKSTAAGIAACKPA